MGSGIWEMNAWRLIQAGGPIMAPIIVCSLFALAIVIEKLIYFSKVKSNAMEFKERIFNLIKTNKIKEAAQACDASGTPLAQILKAGIIKFGSPREEIKEGIEDVSLFIVPRLESKLNALASIAHVTPLLGLLGTVTGMTTCFHTIQVQASSLNPVTPGDLAGGIAEALITTVAGLMVAIPTYVAYNYCVSRVNEFVLEMERGATELVNLICHMTLTGTREGRQASSRDDT